MLPNREHPLYYLDAETRKVAPSELTLVATYIWVGHGRSPYLADELKALEAQGLTLPQKQKHRKATLAELLTLAISKMRPSAFPSGKHLVARSYWSLVARLNLICKVALLTLVHNLSKVV